jgi:hypothetical protein
MARQTSFTRSTGSLCREYSGAVVGMRLPSRAQVQVPQGHALPSAPSWSPQPLVPLTRASRNSSTNALCRLIPITQLVQLIMSAIGEGPLSLRSASGAAFLDALTETHLGGFHALRLGQHAFGGGVELHRGLSEQRCAFGETWLVVHRMMMFG